MEPRTQDIQGKGPSLGDLGLVGGVNLASQKPSSFQLAINELHNTLGQIDGLLDHSIQRLRPVLNDQVGVPSDNEKATVPVGDYATEHARFIQEATIKARAILKKLEMFGQVIDD